MELVDTKEESDTYIISIEKQNIQDSFSLHIDIYEEMYVDKFLALKTIVKKCVILVIMNGKTEKINRQFSILLEIIIASLTVLG